ncbi:hypothetical protein WKI71_37710 [Streptomyces sp. MS1.AVA.1]|uniref:Uncharacterized protein n=1 Tax=Streptomyces machairae TaxID=3134109 RepID=A0ABU8USZ4_9ACTN
MRRLAEKLHLRIPGEGAVQENRIAALGALTGLAAGTGMGVVLGLAHAAGWRPAPSAQYAVAVVGALAATNGPMTVLGVTDPRTWAAADWAADIVPHLAYAVVTVSVFNRLLGPPPTAARAGGRHIVADTVADLIVSMLKASGVRRVYGLPGDSLNGFTDALRRDGTIARGMSGTKRPPPSPPLPRQA